MMLEAQVQIATRWHDKDPALHAQLEASDIHNSQLAGIEAVDEVIRVADIYSQDHPECEKLKMCTAFAGYAIKSTDALLPRTTFHIEIME